MSRYHDPAAKTAEASKRRGLQFAAGTKKKDGIYDKDLGGYRRSASERPGELSISLGELVGGSSDSDGPVSPFSQRGKIMARQQTGFVSAKFVEHEADEDGKKSARFQDAEGLGKNETRNKKVMNRRPTGFARVAGGMSSSDEEERMQSGSKGTARIALEAVEGDDLGRGVSKPLVRKPTGFVRREDAAGASDEETGGVKFAEGLAEEPPSKQAFVRRPTGFVRAADVVGESSEEEEGGVTFADDAVGVPSKKALVRNRILVEHSVISVHIFPCGGVRS
jgi:hypothetical protein